MILLYFFGVVRQMSPIADYWLECQVAEAEAQFQASYEEAQSRLRMSMILSDTVNSKTTELAMHIVLWFF